MGKKGGWFSAVRKAFVSSSDSKEKKDKKPQKTVSKRSWFGKQKGVETDSIPAESAFATPANRSPTPEPEEELKESQKEPSEPIKPESEPSKPTKPENEQSKPTKPENEQRDATKPEKEQNKPTKPENEPSKPKKLENVQCKPKKLEKEQGRSSPVAYATARAAEAAAAFRRLLGKSKEELAAIKIQTAFRRFLAKRKLRALKGTVRLKALVQSQSVKRQAIATLRCMQTLARVQSQVRARRIRMSEENQALQRQLMQKRERELDNMRSTDWDTSKFSKEQIDASIQNKQEATARRERALAYAQTRQQTWRNHSKTANPTFMDPNSPHWGWSWLDRWMAARPWESQSPVDNEPPTPKGLTRSTSVGDMSKKLDGSASVSSPRSPSVSSRRLAPSSPKASNEALQSPKNRRHSISNTSFREEPSSSPKASSSPRVSSPRVSSPRLSKAKSTIPSPSRSPLGSAKKGGSENKTTTGPAKRRMSLSGAPSTSGGRRLSMGPPKTGSGFR